MKTVAYAFCALLPLCADGADRFLVVPNDLHFPAEGNTVGWPFTFSDSGITSRRYQQVYDASQFTSEAPQGGYIKQLWFRADMYGSFGQAGDFLDNVQIDVAITARVPDDLSPVFSENIGAFNTTVYGPSPLNISPTIGWAVIPLAQPFLYIPADGNLVVDIRTTDTSPYPFAQRTFDAEDMLGDSISAVVANDVNATFGFVTTHALVTGFLLEPIPEPSTWALLALGLFGLWRFSVQRNKS